MSDCMRRVPVSEVRYREDLYPRIKPDPATIQRYAEDLDVLPPIEVNQHLELIDGYHRLAAHRKAEADTIAVTITETKTETEFIALACERNAKHGLQLSDRDKKNMAVRLYGGGTGMAKRDIARILSVTERSVSSYLTDIDKQLRDERRETILAMWLACYTQDEIAEAVGLTRRHVGEISSTLEISETLPKSPKLASTYSDADWKPPLYDIWDWAARGDQTKHFGNSHIGIIDNLLYLFTEPCGIVVDPFGGGGSTIDVCRKRYRRYWVSDRKVPEELKHEIGYRTHDLMTDGVSGPAQWTDVQLVYLDPPYWRQAEGEYSDDPTDLGNMDLEKFNAALSGIIKGYATKLKPGAHIALLIQPTQWKSDDRNFPVYHDLDMIASAPKSLRLRYHIICPYSCQQSNAQQVEDTKAESRLLVRSRRLIVWERV